MYSSYTTAVLTLRAKHSFQHTQHTQKPHSCCHHRCNSCCCGPTNLSSSPFQHKLIYGYLLRQSTLIQFLPSRTFHVHTGGCARVDGSYREVIGLLADIGGCDGLGRSVGSKFRRKERVPCRSTSEYSWEGDEEDGFEREVMEGVGRKNVGFRQRGISRDSRKKFQSRQKDIREDIGTGSRKGFDLEQRDERRRVSELEGRGTRKRVEEYVKEDHRRDWEMDSRDVAKEVRFTQEDRGSNWQKDYRDGSQNVRVRSELKEEDTRRALSLRDVVNARIDARRSNSASSESTSSTKLQEISAGHSSDTRRASASRRYGEEVRTNDRVNTSTSGQYSTMTRDQRNQLEQQSVDKLEVSQQYKNKNDVTANRTSGILKQASSNVEVRQQYQNRANRASENVKHGNSNISINQQYDNRSNRASDSVKQISSIVDVNQQYVNQTNVTRNNASDSVKEGSSRILTETRSGQERHATSSANLIQGDSELQNQPDDSLSRQYTSRRGSEKESGVSELLSKAERVADSQRISDTRIERESYSTSAANLVRDRSEQQSRTDSRVDNQYRSRKASEKDTRLSEISRSEVERISNSQQISNERVVRENYSTAVVNAVHDRTEQQNRTNNRFDNQYSSRRASESDARLSATSSSQFKRVSDSQQKQFATIENQNENSSTSLLRGKKDNRLVGESSQAYTGTLGGVSSFPQRRIQAQKDQNDQIISHETYQPKDSRLESASRLDKSSTMYVGEFVDNMRQEMSDSDELDSTTRPSFEIQVEDIHRGTSQSATLVQATALDAATSFEIEKYKEENTRQSSSTSGMKGPPDEMWDVKDPYSEEPYRLEEHAEGSSTVGDADPTTAHARTDNAIIRKSNRSLWTYISDIIRASWALRSGPENSTSKSGTRSASNESANSETWFSGYEPDDNYDESERKEVAGTSIEPVPSKSSVEPSHMRAHSAPSQASPSGTGPGNIMTLSGASSSFSTGDTRRGSQSKGASQESIPEYLSRFKGENAWLRIPFSKTPLEKPSTPNSSAISLTIDKPSTPISSRISPTDKNATTETGRRPKLGSGFLELEVNQELTKEKLPEVGRSEVQNVELKRRNLQRNKHALRESFDEWEEAKEELAKENLPDVGGSGRGTEGKNEQLKQRKLQRNKQVLIESFDEWEEAHNREREQREIDELFMMEALLEARKAADAWEVPVGAVLVQNGKIIARGCNLVEEARDSTAHAEMICIREASSVLRTWRLSETTLYVTLEPCAMCAGAILQSRVDTVVWGAPNKLLGADGSWVRLFPGGDGETNNLEQSSQSTGPVHPFHPKIVIRRGILANECSDVMQQFFQRRRKQKKVPEPAQPSCLPISTHPPKIFSKMHDLFCIMFCL